MRIKLKTGKQKELILLAKEKMSSWAELSDVLEINTHYLSAELRNEKRLISEETYNKLCSLTRTCFNKYILEKKDDQWGRAMGGKISEGNTKKCTDPEKTEELAEIFGIILGDGHIEERIDGYKIRVYYVCIAGNSKTDRDYILGYIPSLFRKVFNEVGNLRELKNRNCAYFTLYGKNIVEFLKKNGLKPGNKVKNNIGIPDWIKKDRPFLKKCLRGLIDTDGSVQIISKNNKNLRIDFTNHAQKLLGDTREAFVELGFSPSKIIKNRHFFLSRQEEILRYMEEIGFSNSKNLKRAKVFLSEKKAPFE